jgi:hypothetical protein
MVGSTAESVVQRQVEAYRARDLDAFCACFSGDVIMLDRDGRVMLRGADALRARYRAVFAAEVHADVVERVHAGCWVVDHEIVRSSERTLEGLIAYRVAGDRIDLVQMIARVRADPGSAAGVGA